MLDFGAEGKVIKKAYVDIEEGQIHYRYCSPEHAEVLVMFH
jgi:hypothetical protein